ncbi:hypothetical protein O181_000819 [Austropuccinia psidii MF-1]|uniref:Uncharacterized protein n=1 Tax=Austropuccinia psidii MF-1 TaxID=1389203 RepID=A0A9Q3B995_9BASI|nr:hypothetical protein [Austropuccinia psidii MF-1]
MIGADGIPLWLQTTPLNMLSKPWNGLIFLASCRAQCTYSTLRLQPNGTVKPLRIAFLLEEKKPPVKTGTKRSTLHRCTTATALVIISLLRTATPQLTVNFRIRNHTINTSLQVMFRASPRAVLYCKISQTNEMSVKLNTPHQSTMDSNVDPTLFSGDEPPSSSSSINADDSVSTITLSKIDKKPS